MNKYEITYTSTTDHNCCSVWCYANSPEQAADYVMSEYWDVEEIISISRCKD